jgi:hypothetical protein
MLRTERVAIEEHTERRILERSMRQAFCQTRAVSPRQLPTDHDYAVSTREYQGDQPSQKLLDRPLALSSQNNSDRKPRERTCNPHLSLLTTVFQNRPRRQGFASPRPHRAPLTAPGRSKTSLSKKERFKSRKPDHPRGEFSA